MRLARVKPQKARFFGMIASTGNVVGRSFFLARPKGSMKQCTVTDEVRKAAEKALQYVHSCQTEDGGYFFARISPSSLRDSHFAVKILRMLGQRPRRPAGVKRFVWAFLQEGEGNPVHTSYLAVEILKDLGEDLEALRHQSEAIEAPLAALNGVSDPSTLYIEVVSELEQLFEAVSVLVHLDIPFDRASVVRLISSLSNRNGGFGSQGSSSLATTYYAARTSVMLDYPLRHPERILSFLRRHERDVYFLENLYYLSSACCILGEALSEPEQAISFVLGCQRGSGGFARARPMGIATLEDTYYAVSLFQQLGAL
jgi:hypothetical protein